MNTLSRSFVVSTLAAVLAVTTAAAPALAKGGPPSSSGSKTSTTTTGNDISWPQCTGSLPSGQAFGIVGVNDGLANNLNPCLAGELIWASNSTGKSSPGTQPKASLYVNTANPGSGVGDWPKTNDASIPNPYNGCFAVNGSYDTQGCAFQYGWERATQDMQWLAQSATTGVTLNPADYVWWLDVETGNSWETGTAGLANNAADLQGMVAAFASATGQSPAVITGVYSTSSQWNQITGTPTGTPAGNLAGLPNWIPGARTASGAASNCGLAPFTGGAVVLTQWFGKPFDGDHACR